MVQYEVVVWETKSGEKIELPLVEVLTKRDLIVLKLNSDGKEKVTMQHSGYLYCGYIHSSHGMLCGIWY